MEIYIVNIVGVDETEPCELDTEVFATKDAALEYLNQNLNDWRQLMRSLFEDDIMYRGDANTFEEWLVQSESSDIETDNYRNVHYIYGCNEKIFSMEKKEV